MGEEPGIIADTRSPTPVLVQMGHETILVEEPPMSLIYIPLPPSSPLALTYSMTTDTTTDHLAHTNARDAEAGKIAVDGGEARSVTRKEDPTD